MFRKSNPTSETSEPVPAAPLRPAQAEEDAKAKAPAKRAVAIPARPLGNPGFPIDIGRRADSAGGPGKADPAPAAGRDKHLIIGKEVRLKGEVMACDKLVVEGEVEIHLSGCRTLQIGPSGVFRGKAEVTDADIAGRFEGEIMTKERLAVRGTGRVAGKIRYGQITIDAGGQVTGEITGLAAEAPASSAPLDSSDLAEATPTAGHAAAATDRP